MKYPTVPISTPPGPGSLEYGAALWWLAKRIILVPVGLAVLLLLILWSGGRLGVGVVRVVVGRG